MRKSAFLLAVIAIVLAERTSVVQSQTSPTKRELVYLEDILDRRVELVGLLGVPIGEVVKLTGKWEPPQVRSKDVRPRFVVTMVNALALETPVPFRAFFARATHDGGKKLRAAEGDIWEMVAYEGIAHREDQRLNIALKQPISSDPDDGLRNYVEGKVMKVTTSGNWREAH